MLTKRILICLAALFITQSSLAADDNGACGPIVKSCLKAGYTRNAPEGKYFWENCMKPILLGKSVSGVTVDAKDVTTCRTFKVMELQKELDEIKQAK